MWKTTIAGLRAHKLRLALTAISIVLGVAFVSGTLILSDTLGHTFDSLFGQVYGKISVQVRQPTGIKDQNGNSVYTPIPQSMVRQVAAIPGVKIAHGTVIGFAQLVDKQGKAIIPQAPTFGANWNDDRQLSSFSIKQGRAPAGSSDVVIDAGTASKYGFRVGDRVKVLSFRAPEEFNVVGIARFGSANNLAGATFALFDTPTAQRLLDREGQFDTINVLAEPGVSAGSLRTTISHRLPGSYQAVTGSQVAKENASRVKQNLSILTKFLLIFALVSLFVGSFIILNTFAMLVAQRTRELGLLRALGASRGQVLASTLGEASVVGLVASVVGIAAGAGVALGLQALFSAIGFTLPSYGMVFKSRTAVVALIVGLGVSLAASLNPARRASRISPIAALGDPVSDGTGSLRRRGIIGTIGTAVGVAVMFFGLFAHTAGRASLVGTGIALTFVGIAVLAPIVASPIAGLLGRPLPVLSRGLIFHRDRSSMSGTLARTNAMRNPRRTSATAAALMVGLALVTMFSVFAESTKASVGTTLDRDFSIDYLVGTTNGFRPFSPTVEQKIAAVPGVGAVSPLRSSSARYGGHSLTIDGVNAATVGRVIRFDFTGGNVTALGKGQLLVEDGAARSRGWKIGQPVRIAFPKTSTQTLVVGGTFKKNQFVDNYMVSTNVYEANFNVQLDQEVLVKAASGVDATTIRPGLERAVGDLPNLSVMDSASVKHQYRNQVNQLLGIIYALLGLSVIIAVIGIINTLVLSVTERTRELGLLRTVGMVRKQVRSMIRGESVVIALFGAVLGLGLGTAFGVALTKATQSSIGTTLVIPIRSLVLFVVFAAAVGVLAAMWPARRAARLNVLDSLASE